MRTLERRGARVLNGADVFALELSKSAQATLLQHARASTRRARSRSTTCSALRACAGRHHLAGAAEARSGRQRRAHPGGRSRWTRSRRSSPPIRTCGCPTTCSCCRSTCRTIPSRASSGWSSWAASCSTRCASRRTAASTCARRRCAIRTTATGSARCRRSGRGAARRVLSRIPTCRADAVETAHAHRARGPARRRRHRVSRDTRRPARVLRHQRQLEPAPVGGRGVRLRSVRARRRTT